MKHQRKEISVLLIEDDPDHARVIRDLLDEAAGADFSLQRVDQLQDGLDLCERDQVDVILLALGQPEEDGIEAIKDLLNQVPAVPVLVLTGVDDEALGVEAAHAGAQDYLVKGQVDSDLLLRAILYSIERQRLLVELRQYALKLHTNHFRLQTIMEHNADGIIITSRNGVTLYINPAAEQLLGRRREELFDQHLGVPLSTTDRKEIKIVRPDGETVNAEVRVVEIEWEGEPAYLASVRDITERARARQVLSQAAREWQSTFDAVEDMIVVLDRDQRILRANEATKRTFGARTLFGAHCHTLFHGIYGPYHNCPATHTFNTGETAHIEIMEEHLDGRWLQMSTYPIKTAKGEVDKVVHVVRDITESKKSEAIQRTLEAKKLVLEELSELNEIKGQFIEVVAHEMRTPMTVIRSGVGLLLAQSLGDLNPKQKEFLELIERNIDRLSRFTTDVLSLSKLDSGKFALRPEMVALLRVIEPPLEMLKVNAAEKQIAISIHQDLDPGLEVCADPDGLSQVVFNVVNNAIMHCPEGTRVELSCSRLDEDFVELLVRDDGPGIPRDSLERIFERFYQVGRKTGPGYKGTGIGLAVCKGLVEKMGGRISADSTVGEGTTFRVLLPTSLAKNEVLFGKIAMFMGHVTPAQLREAIHAQIASENRRKIGEILRDKGYISEVQVDEVLQSQKESLAKPHPVLPASKGEGMLGQLAARYGYISEDQLNECVCIQAMLKDGGKEIRLGQVLVEKEYMSADDIIMVLHMQKQHIGICRECKGRFNVVRRVEKEPIPCPRCGEALEVFTTLDSIEVNGSV
jgi:PAS domain S-box-containing protein